jgi:osmoprotectant transport system permease protein
VIEQTLAWLLDPAHWTGPDGIPTRMTQHIAISLLSIVVAVAIALPIGLYIGHTGRFAFISVNLANIGRAVPSYAVMVLLFIPSIWFSQAIRVIGVDIAFLATFLAMMLLAIPPIVTNTHAGMRDVDRDLVEAAGGMGMRGHQVLRRVEFPIALAVILTGLRIAAVQVVATATLGAIIGGGGLGRYLIDGAARQDYPRLYAGAVLVAILALAVEVGLGYLQRRVVSRGLTGRGLERRDYLEPEDVPGTVRGVA